MLIMWHDRSRNPFRIIAKSHARHKKYGKQGMIDRVDKEYYALYPDFAHSKKVDHHKLYQEWIVQNEYDVLEAPHLQHNPLISIVTPVYNTNAVYLKKMFDSVLAQTYSNWELCIADDASTSQSTLSLIDAYEKAHANIKVTYRKTNGHISEASNTALTLATGEYVAFLDHDDTLSPNALYEMVKKLNTDPKLKLIYSDEDKIDEDDNRTNPHFKSGWNPDMFFSQNYICHLTFIKKDVVDAIGGLRKGYEGSQDYDLLLRALGYISYEEIDRVEKVLYHWRAIKGSTAYGTGEKAYAHMAGLRALQDYFTKKNPLVVVEDGLLPNTYKVNYPLANTLVSIIIPTRDGYEILSKCIKSIRTKTLYTNYEIIVIDNETTCQKTLNYFKKIKAYENVTILEYHQPFNYSVINNYAVSHAKGEVVVLMNNDVEVISPEWLGEMVQHASREEIGAVGAKLYYDNNTIQHAGVVLGIGGVAGHAHKYFEKSQHGYFSRLKIIQNYSAVTAACLAVRKSLYEEVGGLEEDGLKVAFNDVDFCLKLKEKGYRNLWTPYAELYHHESLSRGTNDTPQKQEREQREVAFMKNKWKSKLEEDALYNRNLTNKNENFGIDA